MLEVEVEVVVEEEGGHSQALFGQRGGHLVGQCGELWGVGHVDAAGGGHGAELLGGFFQRDDLGAVVSAGLGRLTETQFVALNLQEGHRWRSHTVTTQHVQNLTTNDYFNCH